MRRPRKSAGIRGATRAPKKPWDDQARERLLASGIALAGLHEGVYLAYCDLVRKRNGARGSKATG